MLQSTAFDMAEKLHSWQSAGDQRLWKLIISPECGERIDLLLLLGGRCQLVLACQYLISDLSKCLVRNGCIMFGAQYQADGRILIRVGPVLLSVVHICSRLRLENPAQTAVAIREQASSPLQRRMLRAPCPFFSYSTSRCPISQ
jgi:hypothetical protein